jgi:ethanolamine ammonia-lyase small subunit
LGRAGGSLPTKSLLDFRLAHARARDALHHQLDQRRLLAALENRSNLAVLQLDSAAHDFNEYLLRPDLGRLLSPESIRQLEEFQPKNAELVVIVSEGLSPRAIEDHAAAVLGELLLLLKRDAWRIGPLCLVRRARVALQDVIGELLGARLALILVGERPGLASPESLGAYLVYAPRTGNTDAQRNCVSNISALGISHTEAALKLHWLLTEARRRQASGVALKDEFRVRGLPPK